MSHRSHIGEVGCAPFRCEEMREKTEVKLYRTVQWYFTIVPLLLQSTLSAQCHDLAMHLLRLLFPVITIIVSLSASLKECITGTFAVDVSILKTTYILRLSKSLQLSFPGMLAVLSVKRQAMWFCNNDFTFKQNQIFLLLDH